MGALNIGRWSMRSGAALGAFVAVLGGLALHSGRAAASGDTWSGTWSRAEDNVAGNLILTQAGASVSGHYTWNDGSGHVSGSVTGSRFSGSFNETHYRGSFVVTLSGKRFTGSYSGVNKDTGGDISGPFDGICIAGQCLSNGAAGAGVASVAGEVTVRRADGSVAPVTSATVLAPGDQLETGVDSHVALTFPDGSRMTLGEMTVVRVADLVVQGSRQNVTVAIKMGEVSAQVNPKKGYQTDFKVQTPSGTTSSRGTKFTVFFDPGARVTIVRTFVHKVVFTPSGRQPRAVIVPAGSEIAATRSGASKLAPIGKVRARGGVDIQSAHDLALALVDRFAVACGLTSTDQRVSVRPAGSKAWSVSIPLGGKAPGTAVLRVSAGKVTASNAVAKRIAAGCP